VFHLPTFDLYSPMTFVHGPAMKNRFMLAPLTNQQSHEDGTLSDDELHWLEMRAQGGFGLTMTCAAHVQKIGQGFHGQLGAWSDDHLEGLTRVADTIRRHGSVSSVQLHHAGMRSPRELIGEAPVCPSEDAETGARALTTAEVEGLIEAFIVAAERVDKAGFDGVEIHGAHGYVLCQFLSPTINRRDDRFGGSLENRARVIREILSGVRARCRPDFQIGLRLSPERFGLEMGEIVTLAGEIMAEGVIDYLDMSLWDVRKLPNDEAFKSKPLLDWFAELPRGEVRLGVAGKIRTPQEARDAMASDIDYILLGRAAILHHDFPDLMRADPDFQPVALPASRDHLRAEGLSDTFVEYMAAWAGFVAPE
jgi:2,4-dienoyl-CoA reductase-like NADH-dependent reductase (Old Yellow Enzyme family)